ncbi:MAG TPA: ferredoxin--NADP reductase, partial [Polyangiaceae bacterium]|nr:ferredoxin--NADP reductase [Polyangiaceae bacterium]
MWNRLSQLGRDIGSALFGNKTSSSKKSSSGKTKDAVRHLEVKEVKRETRDSVSFVLADPTGAPIELLAGQYFTVVRKIGGKSLKRAYSVSSAAGTVNEVRLACKAVPGGKVSPDLVENLKVGEKLEVLGPSGLFTVPDGAKHLVLLGGGSGITPMMSIAHTHLAADEAVKIDLVYGNRSDQDIIFESEIAALTDRYGDRFRVRHVLEEASPKAARVGRLDQPTVLAELDALGSFTDDAYFFVCGPVGMMDEARAALTGRGVAKNRLKEEQFVSAPETDAVEASETQEVEVILEGAATVVYVRPGQTILEAAHEEGVAIPSS